MIRTVAVALFLFPAATLAEGRFRAGEIVIHGSPDTVQGYEVVKYLPRANLTVVRVTAGAEKDKMLEFRGRGRRAGLNRIAYATATPNDAYYDPYQWHFPAVQAEDAWDVNDGSGVTVAVLDTGLTTSGASDGIGCVVTGRDTVNDDATPTDGDGHGTHVSGTIAQSTNNSTGVAGLAYGACIMPVKVLGDDGSGSFADIAEGIYWAVDNGASVINMSLGTSAGSGVTSDAVIDPALDYAYENSVTVVCASGNDGSSKNVSYPAIYKTTIAVGATDYANEVTSYSNGGNGLDLVAPGGDVNVDLNGDGYGDGVLQETYTSGSWGYYFYAGTSMASPHVAAIAAMLISNGTAFTPDQVKRALVDTALDIGTSGVDTMSANGLVQAYDALMAGGCVATEDPEVSCSDGVDNDCDGRTDSDDSDCVSCTVTEDPEVSCSDGVDNDCDGLTDSDDSDCAAACLDPGESCSSSDECCSGRCRRSTCR